MPNLQTQYWFFRTLRHSVSLSTICTGNLFFSFDRTGDTFRFGRRDRTSFGGTFSVEMCFGDVLSQYKRGWLDYTMWLNKLFEWGLSNVYENHSVKHYYTVEAYGTRYSHANDHMASSWIVLVIACLFEDTKPLLVSTLTHDQGSFGAFTWWQFNSLIEAEWRIFASVN